MSDQAPPPTEPAADSLNSDATTTNLEGAVQEAVATDAGIPIDTETPSIAADLDASVPIDSETKDTQMADAPSEQPLVCFTAQHSLFDLISPPVCP